MCFLHEAMHLFLVSVILLCWCIHICVWLHYIGSLTEKLKVTLSCFYALKWFSSLSSRRVWSQSSPVSDYGGAIYRFTCPTTLALHDPLFHDIFATRAIWRIFAFSSLYWMIFAMHRMQHTYMLAYEAIVGQLCRCVRSKFILVQITLFLWPIMRLLAISL